MIFWRYQITFGIATRLLVSLLVILEVMLVGRLGSGKAISHFSGYIWNELNAAKHV